MELFHNDWPLLAPSICFICEEAPGKRQVVDTLRTFEPNGPTTLTGRKYVCESCIETMGKLIGLSSDQAVKRAEAENKVLRQKLKDLKQKLKYVQEITV